METQPRNNKPFILPGALLALLVLAFPSVFSMEQTGAEELSGNQSTLEQQELQLQRLQSQYDTFTTDQEASRALLDMVPSTGELDQGNIIKELEKASVSTNVAMNTLSFQKQTPPPGSPLEQYDLTLQIGGNTLQDLYAFIKTLEDAPRLYEIKDLQLFKNEQGAGGTLGISLYYQAS